MAGSSTWALPEAGTSACPAPVRSGEHENFRREIWLTRACAALTLCALGAFVALDVPSLERGGVPAAIYLVLVSALVYGGLVYQVSRLAWLRRMRAGEAAVSEPAEWDREAEDAARQASVVVLVPSYKEEAAVVRHTLLSAALQDHPSRRVVLLIDDPPNPTDPDDRASLDAMRRLPAELNAELAEPAARFRAALDAFEARCLRGEADAATEAATVARLYETAAQWLTELADRWRVRTHMDRVVVDWVLLRAAAEHRATGERASEVRDLDELAHHHRRLAWLFDAEITSFERKQFPNLSHEPNKAMNLNSYISLLGNEVPDAEYVLTLDADSIILGDYTRTLVEIMRRPEHARVAVAQTPYSSFPGAEGELERLAGATTDMQYIVHQGFSPHGATYWVGANALLRRSALEDISTCAREGPIEVRKYIQDRTVIEDTESSIDLVRRGWTLHNHPQRLAFSATPPDYGALIVQRRRWANGGLIILPKLLRHLVARPWHAAKLAEGFLRVHYLLSIAATNVALIALFIIPFPDTVATAVLPLTAVAYFLLYGRDLRRAGYRPFDVVRVYALNLLLVGANLAGVLKSLHQASTGKRTAFHRTPKVAGRTAAPPIHVVLPVAALVYLGLAILWDGIAGNLLHAALSAGNALLLGYAIRTFVGWRAAREDTAPLLARLSGS